MGSEIEEARKLRIMEQNSYRVRKHRALKKMEMEFNANNADSSESTPENKDSGSEKSKAESSKAIDANSPTVASKLKETDTIKQAKVTISSKVVPENSSNVDSKVKESDPVPFKRIKLSSLSSSKDSEAENRNTESTINGGPKYVLGPIASYTLRSRMKLQDSKTDDSDLKKREPESKVAPENSSNVDSKIKDSDPVPFKRIKLSSLSSSKDTEAENRNTESTINGGPKYVLGPIASYALIMRKKLQNSKIRDSGSEKSKAESSKAIDANSPNVASKLKETETIKQGKVTISSSSSDSELENRNTISTINGGPKYVLGPIANYALRMRKKLQNSKTRDSDLKKRNPESSKVVPENSSNVDSKVKESHPDSSSDPDSETSESEISSSTLSSSSSSPTSSSDSELENRSTGPTIFGGPKYVLGPGISNFLKMRNKLPNSNAPENKNGKSSNAVNVNSSNVQRKLPNSKDQGTQCMTELKQIRIQLKEIQNNQEIIISMLQKVKGLDVIEEEKDFIKKYGVTIPFQSAIAFNSFNANLQLDKDFRNAFIASLDTLIDTQAPVTKSLTNILKRYLSRDVAMKFTTIKKMPGKLVFKETAFYDCLKGTMCKTYLNPTTRKLINETEFSQVFGRVLSNSKDWEGFRKMRATEMSKNKEFPPNNQK